DRGSFQRGQPVELVDLPVDLRVHALLGLAEALRDRVTEVARDGEPLRGQDVRVLVTLGQHEIDRGAGRDGVRPLDVESDLAGPADLVGTGRVERGDAVRRDDIE